MSVTGDKDEEAPLHICQIDRVILDFHVSAGGRRASILLRQVSAEPLLDQPHLKHPIDFLVDDHQIRAVGRRNQGDFFVQELLMTCSENSLNISSFWCLGSSNEAKLYPD